MNIHQALKNSYTLLINRFKTYKLDCEILLANSLKMKNRLDLFLNLEKNLSKNEINEFFNSIQERRKFKPISKIIKKKEFWSLDIDVSKNVLIPRPETEVLLHLG